MDKQLKTAMQWWPGRLSSRHNSHPQKSLHSFSVSNLLVFPSHPPNRNSSHCREVELKKNRLMEARQRPFSTGRLQICATTGRIKTLLYLQCKPSGAEILDDISTTKTMCLTYVFASNRGIICSRLQNYIEISTVLQTVAKCCVATCWVLLVQVWNWSNLSNTPNTSQQGCQTRATLQYVALSCCNRFAVALFSFCW